MAKKLYYKIGEACKMLEIQPYVLRYWETEFPPLSPTKSKSGQRVYSDQDLTVIRRIKELLYDEGYTIAGAKKKLETEGPGGNGASDEPARLSKSEKKSAPPVTPEEFSPEDENQAIDTAEEADVEPDADVELELEATPTEAAAAEEAAPAAPKKRRRASSEGSGLEAGLREVLAEARDLLSFLDAGS